MFGTPAHRYESRRRSMRTPPRAHRLKSELQQSNEENKICLGLAVISRNSGRLMRHSALASKMDDFAVEGLRGSISRSVFRRAPHIFPPLYSKLNNTQQIRLFPRLALTI